MGLWEEAEYEVKRRIYDPLDHTRWKRDPDVIIRHVNSGEEVFDVSVYEDRHSPSGYRIHSTVGPAYISGVNGPQFYWHDNNLPFESWARWAKIDENEKMILQLKYGL